MAEAGLPLQLPARIFALVKVVEDVLILGQVLWDVHLPMYNFSRCFFIYIFHLQEYFLYFMFLYYVLYNLTFT